MPTHTIQFHRVFSAPVERVYRAFLNAEAMVKWLPPHGYTGQVLSQDLREGGLYRMAFTHFASGHSFSFGGRYLELVPNQRIRHDDTFDNPDLPGTMVTTITFASVSCGTELNITQEGIPEAIPPESCYLGWQESLALLALLVEAERPTE